ncbi:hypothetical protein F0L74_20835 [Chitinophaga agrisoli]|uniref:Uncharacterized protein n=1 Tax=Chitinophaga agrisoli TaxID=2607653 RepID=A0A5B2VJ21_9BACT|nr:hypothetical protein [Chitinophaga agrisoli]KAA2238668.1 hypothetical protein F0L74_20835 [Chitinophaga agrisoli]
MRALPVLLLLIFFRVDNISAQNMAGEYYLRGVMETASGFRLNADSSFDFFFSQGALDRYGKGKYKIVNDSIQFTSVTSQDHDFTLVNSSKQPGKNTVIKITEPNQQLLKYVFVRVRSGQTIKGDFADSDGYFRYEGPHPDSIEMMFEFCPEKCTVVPVSNDHNYFEFKFEPWLFEYFFRDFRLQLSGPQLKGGHPLLQGNAFVYNKEE